MTMAISASSSVKPADPLPWGRLLLGRGFDTDTAGEPIDADLVGFSPGLEADRAASRAAIGMKAHAGDSLGALLGGTGVGEDGDGRRNLQWLRRIARAHHPIGEVDDHRLVGAEANGAGPGGTAARGELMRRCLQRVAAAGAQAYADKARHDRQHEQNSDHFNEGEAALATSHVSHRLVISSFSPVPPTWLSAPREKISKGPLWPGAR